MSAYTSSAHGHVNVIVPNRIANSHANEFSVAIARSDEMESEKIMVRTCIWSFVTNTFLIQARDAVRQVLQAFDFASDKCGVTRTVFVDPQRSGPFQVFTVFVCVA
jgi:hypothetical protein